MYMRGRSNSLLLRLTCVSNVPLEEATCRNCSEFGTLTFVLILKPRLGATLGEPSSLFLIVATFTSSQPSTLASEALALSSQRYIAGGLLFEQARYLEAHPS